MLQLRRLDLTAADSLLVLFRMVTSIRLAVVAAALLLGGCTYEQNRSVGAHFNAFNTEPPRGSSVTVCHAYGCKKRTRVHLSGDDMAAIKQLMDEKRTVDNAERERIAVAYAVGWLERRVGAVTGTSADRAGMELFGPGDPTQQDCVDEATNTTSYLVLLHSHGLIKYHTIGTPFAKENLTRGIAGWPHWTAVLNESSSGQRWAVDSWIYANGENPAIVEAEHWYIDDLANLPKSTL